MEWNIYKEWLDINLYRQMVSMIYQSSSREDKMNFMRKEKENDLFYGAYKQSLEEEYGLYYPDEVLERINAHRSMTKPVYRALGLALAKKPFLEAVWQSTWKKGSVLHFSWMPAFGKRPEILVR